MPIINRQTSFPVLGRVALGYLTTNAAGKTYPAKADTMVFSAEDQELLAHVAAVLGGLVEAVPTDEDETTRWRLITKAKELHVRLPSDDDRAFQQWYERWGRGGIVRRCDGVTCQFAVTANAGPPQRDVPCVCDGEQLPDADRCDPTTRLNVVVEELFTVPRMGLWQITSRGWDSSREIASTVDLLRAGGAVIGVPLLLRVEERTRRAKDGKSYEFPVFTLVPLVSFAEVAALRGKAVRGFLPEAAVGDTPVQTVQPTAEPAPGNPMTAAPSEAPAAAVAWQASFLKTSEQITGSNDLEKIAYLRTVCNEYVKHMGIPVADANALWLKIGTPEKTLDDYRRLYAVLSAQSVGVSREAAVAGVLKLLPLEDVPF